MEARAHEGHGWWGFYCYAVVACSQGLALSTFSIGKMRQPSSKERGGEQLGETSHGQSIASVGPNTQGMIITIITIMTGMIITIITIMMSRKMVITRMATRLHATTTAISHVHAVAGKHQLATPPTASGTLATVITATV
jgi:hypothetical protein